MKISIIIPHYNSWEYLSELLNTIQTNKDMEIIVVDDMSTDAKNKIKQMSKIFPHVKFIENMSGVKGAGKARNIGLELASGKWILFADSDDLFTDKMSEIIQKYADSDYDLIYFAPTSFHQQNSIKSDRHVPYESLIYNYTEDKSLNSELELKYKFITPWSKMIKKELIQKNKIYFEEIMWANDILFSAKVGYYSKQFYATEEILYKIRENPGSLTSDLTQEKYLVRYKAWKDYVLFLKSKLSKSDFNLLHISILSQLIVIKNNNLPLSNIWTFIKDTRKYKLPIFNKQFLNPNFIIRLSKRI